MLQTRQFPYTYDDILGFSRKIDLGHYQELVEKAYKIRKRDGTIKAQEIIRNITYINNFIEPFLKREYDKNKDLIVIKN